MLWMLTLKDAQHISLKSILRFRISMWIEIYERNFNLNYKMNIGPSDYQNDIFMSMLKLYISGLFEWLIKFINK